MVTMKEEGEVRTGARVPEDLAKRTKRFALAIIKLVSRIPGSDTGSVLGRQVLRSGTSIGANYREGKRGRSTDEFTAKLGIAQFEAEETCYWLELLIESGISDDVRTRELLKEANELQAILGACIRTARNGRGRRAA